MYGLWIITIILGIVVAPGIALIVIGFKKDIDAMWIIGVIKCFLFGIFFILLFVFSIILPISADTEYRKFEATRQIIEMAIEDGSDLENIAITQMIVEANEWYASAKISKEKWGNWSMYYKLDFDKIEPIRR